MVRNLSKRVEVVTPVLTAAHKERLWEFLDICLNDRRQAWVLGSDGAYTQLHSEEQSIGTHQAVMNLMRTRA